MTMFTGGALAALRPASMVLDGTTSKLTRTLATSSPPTTKFSFSAWSKGNYNVNGVIRLFRTFNPGTPTEHIRGQMQNAPDQVGLFQDVNGTANDWGSPLDSLFGMPVPSSSVWTHVLYVYDSTLAIPNDRVKMYYNGVLLGTSMTDAPALNEAHAMFTNGWTHELGTGVSDFWGGKFAFIECLAGIAAQPGDFCFRDSHVWKRRLYTGSYGTYGYFLDGSVIGRDRTLQGNTFTPTNVTKDTADLPPSLTAPFTSTPGFLVHDGTMDAAASSYTLTSATLGHPGSGNRYVVAVVSWSSAGVARTLSSATIAGNAVTIHRQQGTASFGMAIIGASVASGLTGNIALTFSGAVVCVTIATHALYGLSSTTPTATDGNNAGTNMSLNIPSGGNLISAGNGNVSTPGTYVGGTKRWGSNTAGGTLGVHGACDLGMGSETGRVVNPTNTGPNVAAVWA